MSLCIVATAVEGSHSLGAIFFPGVEQAGVYCGAREVVERHLVVVEERTRRVEKKGDPFLVLLEEASAWQFHPSSFALTPISRDGGSSWRWDEASAGLSITLVSMPLLPEDEEFRTAVEGRSDTFLAVADRPPLLLVQRESGSVQSELARSFRARKASESGSWCFMEQEETIWGSNKSLGAAPGPLSPGALFSSCVRVDSRQLTSSSNSSSSKKFARSARNDKK